MKLRFLFILLLFCAAQSYGNILHDIWGRPDADNISAFPTGYHVEFFGHKQPNNEQYYFSVTLHGIIAGTFINSFSHRVYFVGVERNVYNHDCFSVNYFIGVMTGYRKDLYHQLGHIIGHDPGPLAAIELQWHVTPRFSVNVGTDALTVLWGVSYRI